MKPIKCPHCGKTHEFNIASAFAKLRTEKLTEEERKEIGKRLLASRKSKKYSHKEVVKELLKQ